MAKGGISKRIAFAAGTALCCVFALMLLCNLTIIIKGVIHPQTPPSVFGVTPMVVQSGSMSGNAEDHIEVGDLIFTVKPNIAELKKGDIAFELELFPFLPVIIRFWEADDEFPANLQILVDRNILDYMHYETLMFALTHLFHRLKEEIHNDKG